MTTGAALMPLLSGTGYPVTHGRQTRSDRPPARTHQERSRIASFLQRAVVASLKAPLVSLSKPRGGPARSRTGKGVETSEPTGEWQIMVHRSQIPFLR